VENDIKYIKRNFWPQYREQERQFGHEVPHSDKLQSYLEKWSENTAHKRIIQGKGARPIDLFQEEEKDALLPLPPQRWQETTWACAKVQETWRIQFDCALYSVPYHLIGKRVQLFITDETVEIYDEYTLVALHSRAKRPWQHMHNPAHDPPNVKEYTAFTRDGLVQSARSISPEVGMVVQSLLDRKVVEGLNPARALLRLEKKYGKERLITACERAIYYDNLEYRTIKSILSQNLDLKPEEKSLDAYGNYCFTFSRPVGYFDSRPASFTGGLRDE